MQQGEVQLRIELSQQKVAFLLAIPAGSMDLPHLVCQQKGGQHGPRTEK